MPQLNSKSQTKKSDLGSGLRFLRFDPREQESQAKNRKIGGLTPILVLFLNRLANDCLRPSFSVIILSMPETSIQSPPGFNELPKAEQVRYLQALWDQISANPDEVPVPESHLQLSEERLRRYREDPSTAKPAFDVIDRLTRKSK